MTYWLYEVANVTHYINVEKMMSANILWHELENLISY